MSGPVREWLPGGALCDGALEQALTASVDDWAATWLAAPGPAKVRIRPVTHNLPAVPAEAGWYSDDGSLRLLLSGPARGRLAREALGYRGRFTGKKSQDHGLMLSLSERILDDLCQRVTKVFPGAGPMVSAVPEGASGWPVCSQGGVSVSLDLFGEAAFAVFFCAHDLACNARRALLSAPAPRVLPPLHEALARQPVGVGGYAGATRLTLSEFRGMRAGDVLELDRTLSEGIPLSLNRRARLPLVSDLEIEASAARLRVRGAA